MPPSPTPSEPMLDVLEVLFEALNEGGLVDGWTITKLSRRTGPTVYKVIDRLEDAGWISAEWEERQGRDAAKPRRRLYRLKPNAAAPARDMLKARASQRRLAQNPFNPGVVQAVTT